MVWHYLDNFFLHVTFITYLFLFMFFSSIKPAATTKCFGSGSALIRIKFYPWIWICIQNADPESLILHIFTYIACVFSKIKAWSLPVYKEKMKRCRHIHADPVLIGARIRNSGCTFWFWVESGSAWNGCGSETPSPRIYILSIYFISNSIGLTFLFILCSS